MKTDDFSKYLKKGKNIVVELDDEVEYVIYDQAVESIKNGEGTAVLIRIVDYTPQLVATSRIWTSIKEKGIIDYLDKRE